MTRPGAPGGRHTRRALAGVATAVALVCALVPTVGASAAGTFVTPTVIRDIGGRGEAAVYAWGAQYNPVSREMLVGDYWNFQIRRYDLYGRLLGSFFRPASQRKGQPYSIAVDPRDGSIYVPEISDGKARGYIAKYDRYGTFLYEIRTTARYYAWITVDAAGALYIADSHYWQSASSPSQIRKYTVTAGTTTTPGTATQIRSWGTFGSGPGQFGIVHGLDTDAAGNVYVADATNRVVHKFTSTGSWIRDFGGKGSDVGQFSGDLRGLTVDSARGVVYVVDAESGEIEKFTTDGVALGHWGSTGQGPGQFADGGRQLDFDLSGNVWVADYGNFRVLKFTPDGLLGRTVPDPPAPPPPGGMSQARDVAVDRVSGDVWVADSWNNRFQRFGANGSFEGTWGVRNSHPPYGMNYPRGIGVDSARSRVWVADTREHKVRVYDYRSPDPIHVRSLGDIDSSSAGNFRWPIDIEVAGNVVYVADYVGDRVKRFDAATFAELPGAIVHSNNAITVDPVTKDVFLLDWDMDRVYRHRASDLALIGYWGSTGTGDGQFGNPWDIDLVNGVLYVSDAQLARVQAFDLNGNFLGKFGSPGSKPGQLNNPSGLDHDAAGNIYVADAGNDRVQVFSPLGGLRGGTTAPTVAATSPVDSNPAPVVPAATVWLAGTAADDGGIGTVEVAVRNRATALWWNASLATWSTTKTWNLAQVSGADLRNATWRFPFNGPVRSGQYGFQARAYDLGAMVSSQTGTPLRYFDVGP